ncbi:hypothetical protein SESBI_29375 [Sesbania bispinosa]|nr:hypothetical protein SESBI_29375 [Sesbania bispinosa]
MENRRKRVAVFVNGVRVSQTPRIYAAESRQDKEERLTVKERAKCGCEVINKTRVPR